jgi:hypothetical protein
MSAVPDPPPRITDVPELEAVELDGYFSNVRWVRQFYVDGDPRAVNR